MSASGGLHERLAAAPSQPLGVNTPLRHCGYRIFPWNWYSSAGLFRGNAPRLTSEDIPTSLALPTRSASVNTGYGSDPSRVWPYLLNAALASRSVTSTPNDFQTWTKRSTSTTRVLSGSVRLNAFVRSSRSAQCNWRLALSAARICSSSSWSRLPTARLCRYAASTASSSLMLRRPVFLASAATGATAAPPALPVESLPVARRVALSRSTGRPFRSVVGIPATGLATTTTGLGLATRLKSPYGSPNFLDSQNGGR
mmetsp:Transcript_10181/g.46646  ORF Transcript_10181/g.46646 Transcript_10181/m.46646 type:complete len:255 (-) Transcript_10181:275-1039(-)